MQNGSRRPTASQPSPLATTSVISTESSPNDEPSGAGGNASGCGAQVRPSTDVQLARWPPILPTATRPPGQAASLVAASLFCRCHVTPPSGESRKTPPLMAPRSSRPQPTAADRVPVQMTSWNARLLTDGCAGIAFQTAGIGIAVGAGNGVAVGMAVGIGVTVAVGLMVAVGRALGTAAIDGVTLLSAEHPSTSSAAMSVTHQRRLAMIGSHRSPFGMPVLGSGSGSEFGHRTSRQRKCFGSGPHHGCRTASGARPRPPRMRRAAPRRNHGLASSRTANREP